MNEKKMISEERLTWDHGSFYLEGERFSPLIHEETSIGNGVLLKVPYLAEKRVLDALEEKAFFAVLEKKRIIWEFEFFSDKKRLFIQDTSCFFSFALFLEELVARFFPSFKENTLAFILFRGGIDLSSYFVWTEQQERLYQEKLIEYPLLEEKDGKVFFAADLFSEYLQRLSSFLPDTLPVICLFDTSPVLSPSYLSYLFSKERFGHLLLGLKKSPVPLSHLVWEEGAGFGGWIGKGLIPSLVYEEVKTALCLPVFHKISRERLFLLDQVVATLLKKKISFRFLSEESLHENWDGIDDLIVISSLLTVSGIRKVRGFLAAGGRLLTVGSFLGMENEMDFSFL